MTKKISTNNKIQITGPNHYKHDDCEKILRSLPQWFGIEEAIVNYTKEIQGLPTFIASKEDNETIGFLSLKNHFSKSSELYVMGIKQEFHRLGIGRRLVNAAQEYCKSQNIQFLQVKTLSPARESVEYEATRHFYLSLGFTPLEELKDLWGSENPCLLMIKKL